MKYLIAPFFILTLSVQALAFRKGTDDSSIMNECLWNQAALSSEVECSDMYHHYLPESAKYKPTSKVRLGSYNILRTSEQKSRKNLDLTAEMINSEWDIVALSELQPGRSDEIIEGNKPGADYILPAYIQLFLKLQEKDSSWGMIVSPFSQGSDSEILGFMYRGKKAKPVESEYCKANYLDAPPYEKDFVFREINEKGIVTSKNSDPVNDRDYVSPDKALACPLALTGLRSKYFIKLPLTARFKSGDFEFSYISLHLSFRGIEEFDSECMATCQLQNLKIISSLNGFEDNTIASAIDELRENSETIRIIEGTENKIPKASKRCAIDPRKLTSNKEKEEKRFASCIKRLNKLLSYIEKRGFLPKSCKNIAASIENEEKYEQCEGDYRDLRKAGYSELIEDIFNNIVKKKMASDSKDHFSGIVSELFDILGKDNTISKGEGREFARFYQVYSVMAEAGAIKTQEKTNDVIVAGDFNLEVETNKTSWRSKMWNYSLTLLPEAELFITGLTSLNVKRALANNYDHFILSPSETNECNAKEAYILNYLTDVLSNGFDLGKAVQDEDYHFVMSDHLPIGMTCSAK